MTRGGESISPTMLWQPWCCDFLLARAAGANRHSTCALTIMQTETHSLSHSINLPSFLHISMDCPSILLRVVRACICVHARMCLCLVFSPYPSSFISPICFPLLVADTCCNKVNEFGKWQDSRWYFSKQLPSNSTVGEAGSWLSEWDDCVCLCTCASCVLHWHFWKLLVY